MLVLGIESSCDDTGVGIVADGREVLAARVQSSAMLHEEFGGIVPELASREHVMAILPAIQSVLKESGIGLSQIDAIAVTRGPGLLGSLLVGVTAAKTLSLAVSRPLIGVNHLEAHLYANALVAPIEFPAVALLVSGGHSAIYRWSDHGRLQLLGETVDDAAGEALDKGARTLGLGYPGGPAVERLARTVSTTDLKLPIPHLRHPERHFDLSFSGLKTALVDLHQRHPERLAELAYALETAVVESLVRQAVAAALSENVRHLYLAGGVSANQRLRAALEERAEGHQIAVHCPLRQYSTDNGAMVACAGYYHWRLGHFMGLDQGPRTPFPLGEDLALTES